MTHVLGSYDAPIFACVTAVRGGLFKIHVEPCGRPQTLDRRGAFPIRMYDAWGAGPGGVAGQVAEKAGNRAEEKIGLPTERKNRSDLV